MSAALQIFEWLCLIPAAGGSVYAVLCLITAAWFRIRRPDSDATQFASWPPVTILKPVHGLEKNQRQNLRSTCIQDYPEFQVVFSVQDPADPAVGLLLEIQREFGAERVTVAPENRLDIQQSQHRCE